MSHVYTSGEKSENVSDSMLKL